MGMHFNSIFRLFFVDLPGVPGKNATDLKILMEDCFILVIKRIFLVKSAITRIKFDIFSSIFGELVVKLKISKVQNCP